MGEYEARYQALMTFLVLALAVAVISIAVAFVSVNDITPYASSTK
jgi:hypothetical protein